MYGHIWIRRLYIGELGCFQVAKEGGEKWKSLTDEEKKVYQDKAAELKAQYQKALEADNAEAGDVDNAEAGDADNAEAGEVKA